MGARPRKTERQAWDEALDARLRALWAEGHSTAEIGRRMGLTKNAVVGRVHRLKLPPRPSPMLSRGGDTARHVPTRGAAELAKAVARATAASGIPARAPCAGPAGVASPAELPPAALVAPRPEALSVQPRGGCCWPMWGHKQRPTHEYCGRPRSFRADGVPRPYCAAHAAKATARDPAQPLRVTRSTFAWGGVAA